MSEELPRCPFCGSEKVLHSTVHPSINEDPYDVVMCQECGASTRHPDGGIAKERWKARKLPYELNATLTALGRFLSIGRHDAKAIHELRGAYLDYEDYRKGL